MKRRAYLELVKWKDSVTKKPLIIRGARQVGKTWLMREFGRNEYDQMVYVNFERDKHLHDIFKKEFNIARIIAALQIESGLTIRSENTLLVFDEIQSLPEAISSLKYFFEEKDRYDIIAAGSLLGMANYSDVSFPVGKVDFIDLYPLDFTEFLNATGNSALNELLEKSDWDLVKIYKSRYINLLREYFFVGGMPEAVSSYISEKDFKAVRKIQNNILDAYEFDFSKHPPAGTASRIRMLWNSIPSQLAKENRKFVYGLIREGARAKEYESAIAWLADCGHVYRISRVTKPNIPLKAYEDLRSFKIYIVDIGLLTAMTSLDTGTLIEGNRLFTEFKGALTEQYVLQQLISNRDFVINYWSAERSTAEVDFLIQANNRVIPIEVKAEENLKAKSLKAFKEKFNPEISVRTSMSDYRSQDWLVNVPLYAIGVLAEILDDVI
ncbi:MAG: AAA family ATPase [Bacteroidales bacterium]